MTHPQKKRVNIKNSKPEIVKLEKLEPVELSDVELAFPADVRKLMPMREEIPDTFRHTGLNPWTELTNTLFFKGGNLTLLQAKEGFDKVRALRHIRAVLSSFQPKHEHKIEAVAYLLSLWFEPLPDDWQEKLREGA